MLLSSPLQAGPYTGQDIVDGLSILGDIANGLAGAARAQQEAQQEILARQANKCAAFDMTKVLNGAKSNEDVQNLYRLVEDHTIAKRIMIKCVPTTLDSNTWNLESVHAAIVQPRWNEWVAAYNEQNVKEQRQAALEREHAIIDAYFACIKENTIMFSSASDENAENVIAAARGACSRQRGALYDAAQQAGENPETLIDSADKSIHDPMMSWVLSVRAELKARVGVSQPASPSDGAIAVKTHSY
jgi:hypothetical protein